MIFFFTKTTRLDIIHGYKQYGFSQSTCDVRCKVVEYMMLICDVCGLIARKAAIRKV